MFGDKLDIEASCLDPQCNGTFVAQFEGKEGAESVVSNCSSCQVRYNVVRSDYTDVDGCIWKVVTMIE